MIPPTRTRVICTLTVPVAGGARPQDAPDFVDRLVAAGMDCARLNLSHAPAFADFEAGRPPRYDAEEAVLRAVREASAKARPGRLVATLLDVQGIKVRLHLPRKDRSAGRRLASGSTLRVRITRDRPADEVSCDGAPALASSLAAALAAHGEIETAIGDGDPMLRCVGLEGDVAVLLARQDAVLLDGKGVAFRGVRPVDEPALTRKDRVDLAVFAVPALIAGSADFLALSFAQDAASIRRLRACCEAAAAFFRDGVVPSDPEDADVFARLAALRPDLATRYAGPLQRPSVVAKIETAAGAAEIDGILREADAVMVARGDLGLNCPPEDVPRLQKDLLRCARLRGRAGIVATQMLASMERAPEPTRAEATDVFNAVLDGADALLLSGETSVGTRPAEATSTLVRVVRAAEAWECSRSSARDAALISLFDDVVATRGAEDGTAWRDTTDRITFEAVRTAESLGAAAIVAATRTGGTARNVARFDPQVLVLAIVPDAAVGRRLALVGSVLAIVAPAESGADALARGLARAVEIGLLRRGDRVVVAAAADDPAGATTSLEVRTVG